jgi:signal transduction histidine kinase
VSWYTNGYYHGWVAENGLYFGLFCAAAFALSTGLLWFLLSLVRIGKAGLFVQRSLIGLFVTVPCKALGGAIKSGFDGRNPLAKSLVLVILFWFVTAVLAGIGGIFVSRQGGGALLLFGFLLVLVLAVAIRFTYKWAERYGRLRRGVEEIAGGNLGYRIEVAGDGKNEFDRLSSFVNELGSAQNAALQSELKNQRLKTDLISNVSHDLKTPLTSILTYTDLLKAEGLKSKNADEYLKVIDEKGQRLKKLTDDLFEAAKASSGALNVRREKVDLLELLEQEIAEMNGSFAEAGLELIVEAPAGHYFVEADSQLLWRVVDNLLRNARKYALPGTRVYIDLKERQADGGQSGVPLMTTFEIKNISAIKLNIPPEELMERFKRGDESRATDGSGLGLAIAKDLVRLQNGWFEISIDGDLFKAVVMLPQYTA